MNQHVGNIKGITGGDVMYARNSQIQYNIILINGFPTIVPLPPKNVD